MTKKKKKKTHIFNIDYYSPIDEVHYQGSFTTKKLSIADIAAVGVRKAQLNGGMYYDNQRPGQGVDFHTDDFNAMIAHVEVAIISAPKWWNLRSISDSDLLFEVFAEVDQFENSFLQRGRNGDSAGGLMDGDQEDSSEDQESTNGSRSTRTVVDQEVQAALEP